MPGRLVVVPAALFALLVGGASAMAAQCPAMTPGPLPLKYAGRPTIAAISACDLMTRLYIFADDSMRGRRAGTADNVRATEYIAAEAKRLGLKPAGDSAGFFQYLPTVTRALDTSSTIVVAGTTLRAGVDFLASTTAMHPADFRGVQLMYGGTLLDTTATLTPAATDGRLVLFRRVAPGIDQGAIQRTPKGRDWVTWYNTIRNRASANDPQISPQALRAALNSTATVMLAEQGAAISLTLTVGAAATLFGGSLDSVAAGTLSKPFVLNLRFVDTPRPTRNVVAIFPGTDAKLKGEYVALGAHSDHVGVGRSPLDHDSLRAFNMVSRAGTEGAASHKQTTEDDEYDRIHALTDSMHKARPVRPDSIFNGADDGGSGTVALLEIAEGFAKGTAKPRRSILFVWHTSAESNPVLAGSSWFVDHPTVPRDSIVAQLGVDMIGHGEATDETGVTMDEEPRHGNPDYVGLIGPRRLSAELGRLIETANTEARLGLRLDVASDAPNHPDGLFCRNDPSSYARYGIPVAFFTTGFHADYRQVTDEPQYIRYQHMARIVQLVSASGLKLANLDHRPALDHPKPAPNARCTP